MYGIYGGFTSLMHIAVRFPILMMCVGAGGITYEAVKCLPQPIHIAQAEPLPVPKTIITPIVIAPPVVVMKDISVYFDVDKSIIKKEYQDRIKEEAAYLNANPNVSVLVEGNTDARHSVPYNLALGMRRAQAVRIALISNGVADSRIRTVSYGKAKERLLCHFEKCYKENRRVDVYSK